MNREVEQLSTEDQRDQIIRELRQTLVLLREKNAAQAVAPDAAPARNTTAPVSLRTRSRVAIAGIVTGKYTVVISVAALLARAIAKHYPNWAESVELFLQGFGL